MIQLEYPISEAVYDALFQMASYTKASSGRMAQIEEAIEYQLMGVIIEALESRHVEDVSSAISQIYREVINPSLGPAFHLVRTCVSHGTLTTDVLWIQAALLTEDLERIINEHAG